MYLGEWAAIVAGSLFCLAGCASSPTPAAGSSSLAPPAPSSSAPASPVASAPASSPGRFEASVVTVSISVDQEVLRRVKIEFRNETDRPCKVDGYLVEWPGGKKPGRPEGVVIPPKQSRERWLRVDKADGDMSSLTADVAKVTLQSDCPVKAP
jgi:hypothetical protein